MTNTGYMSDEELAQAQAFVGDLDRLTPEGARYNVAGWMDRLITEVKDHKDRWQKLKALLEGQRSHFGSDGPAVCYVHEVVEEMEKLEPQGPQTRGSATDSQ